MSILYFFVVVLLSLCLVLFFFFSSRRRHTRCALVTGVQTCALPILWPWLSRWRPVVRGQCVHVPEAADQRLAVQRLELVELAEIGRASCRERVCKYV